MMIDKTQTVTERRKTVEKLSGASLPHIGTYSLDESNASTKHCEMMIGAAQIPLGVVGPLHLHHIDSNSKSADAKNLFVPLATTEGALIASVNRGCKALTLGGGAAVDTYRVGATRGPVFRVKDLQESNALKIFLESHLEDFQKVVATTSTHTHLQSVFSRGVGHYRYVRFVFDTEDAMGLNMVTIATDAIVRYIQQQTGILCSALSGNYCTDKKSSWLNTIEGRGIQVWAEITLSDDILCDVLKTSASKFYETWIAKCMVGSIMSGSMGWNAQYANVIAAIFLATGQDLGHVGEASTGMTLVEQVSGGLYVSVHLPDLMIGTVGGGTGLETQQEALSLLGVAGGDHGMNAMRFAEIIAATVLAGEISLLASLSEGTLAQAHKQLARGQTT